MRENGLTSFAMHSDDAEQGQTVATISDELARADRARSLDFEPSKLAPDTAAKRYLHQLIASPSVPTLTAAGTGETDPEYRTIATETVPLTGTTVVKLAQYYHKIPVYGSLVTIELGADNSLLAVNSALGDPAGVDPVASISPAQARDVIREEAGREEAGSGPSPLEDPPRLYFFFDNWVEPHGWRLVYIAKNVLRETTGDEESGDEESGGYPPMPDVPELVDYVVDAHTGELVAALPRTQTVTWETSEQAEDDAQGKSRHIRMQQDGAGNRRLSDTVRNVRTHDFNYQDAGSAGLLLPGEFVANPPGPWSGAAISAHANAADVAEFLVTVLQRDGLDNMGGPFISSINCTYGNRDPGDREWRNAAWIGTQMIYGQRTVDGELQSYALAKDVVAHEIIHGLTDNSARLEYARESGALNESYSDILGIIISNADQADSGQWNWEMGEDLDVTGVPLRDLSDPTRMGQPSHMRDFRRLGATEVPSRFNDWGGVHHNSGIHNKAAFNLMTSKTANGSLGFTPQEGAALFYLALTQFLSRTSGFSDSRRGVELAAKTLFRNDPPDIRDWKLAAIATAFDDVGIDA